MDKPLNDDPPDPEPEPEPPRVLLHMPVDVRSLALGILAIVAVIWLLHWARDVFIPVMLGILFSYPLAPLVDRLVRWRIPRGVAAAALLLGLMGALGAGAWALSDDADDLLRSLPTATQKLREAVRAKMSSRDSAIDRVQKAAAELERAAIESGGNVPGTTRGVTRVTIEPSRFKVSDYLWTGTVGLVSLIGQMIVVFFITFFLLASGDTFRRKIVRIAGPTFARRKITVQALDEITVQVQGYLLVQVVCSVLVGVASWLAYLAMGLEHAAVWGVAAAILNLVPYIGSIAVTGGTALVGFMQFGTIEMAMAVAAVSLVINSIEGYLLMPWLTSRTSRMNPVVIFVGVLAWGWLWGVWGLLLGIPILMIIKAVCDRVDDLKPVGELLGA
jgi:predicted PurR-regulated permease PerM